MNTRLDYLANAGGILGGLLGTALVCLILTAIAAVSPVLCLLLASGLIGGAVIGALVGFHEIDLYFQMGGYSKKGTPGDRIMGAIFGVGIGGFPIGLLIPALLFVGICLATLLNLVITDIEARFS
jgi:hypothetical protein